MNRALLLVAAAAVTIGACALRTGRAAPETFRIALATTPVAPAAARMGEWVRALDAHIAFVATRADSAWFAQLSGAASMAASGPSATGAILAWAAVGDTTLQLDADGAALVVQDALYETARGRMLDLMLVEVDSGADPRAATRALMTYVATDVMHDAIVMLALRAPDRASADSIGVLLQPAFGSVARCDDQHDLIAGVPSGALRLYYRPAVRVRCDAVRGFDSPFPALLARVVLDG